MATPESSLSPRPVVVRIGDEPAADPETWRALARHVTAAPSDLRIAIVCAPLPGSLESLEAFLDAAGAGKYRASPDAGEAAANALRNRGVALAGSVGARLDSDGAFESLIDALNRDLYGASLLGEVTPRLRGRVHAAAALVTAACGAAIIEHLLENKADVGWADVSSLAFSGVRESTDGLAHRVMLTQGASPDGETEHGALAGGADIWAALLAERLGAARLEIWSDQSGFFSADPELVPSARLLRHIGYDEAQEIASAASERLHPRALDVARRSGVEVQVRDASGISVGTVISSRAPDPPGGVLALAMKPDVTLITMHSAGMWQQVGFLADVFGVYQRHGISVDLVSTSETSVAVTLDPTANVLDEVVLTSLVDELRRHCEPTVRRGLVTVAVVGRRLRAVLPELATAFEVLGGQSVHLISQAASDLNLSAVVEEEQADRIIRELHAAFFGAAAEGEVFGPTRDRVSAVPGQQPPETPWWRERRQELLQAATLGTPRYVYDLPTVRARARVLAGSEPVQRVLYSVKANEHPDILAALHAEGLGFECVSLPEVEHVLRSVAGVTPGEILFTPNFAPRHEYARAIELGVIVTVDNLFVLERWGDIFAGRDLLVRVDPGHGRGHHARVRTAGPGSKFGVAPAALPRVAELVDRVHASVIGLHAHLGSGITDPLAWAETAAVLADLTTHLPDVRVLDLGGGLAAPLPGGPSFDVEAASRHLQAFKDVHPQFELWLEPGRYLVAEGGVLLATATQIKSKEKARFVGVDAGMHTLIRPALYGAYHEIVNLSRLDEAAEMTAEVVGPICESGDVLGHARRLPETKEGDVMLIATAGAYGRVMSSMYNRRALPEETVLD